MNVVMHDPSLANKPPRWPARRMAGLRAALLATALAAANLPAAAALLAGQAPLAAPDGEQVDASTPPLSQGYVLGSAGVLESIAWWGFHDSTSGGAAFDNFVVSLDGVGQTGSLSKTDAGAELTRYELDITDIALASGHTGSLAVVNDSLDVQWFWQLSNAGTRSLSYSLLGSAAAVPVPEPAGWALVLFALACARTARARRAG